MMLPMSDAEIARRYRNAIDPQKSIGILAQLNACDKKDIYAALRRAGIVLEASKKPPVLRRKLDQELAYSLYKRGLLDREIASVMRVPYHTIYTWRSRKGLPANGRGKKGGDAT